MYSIDINPIKPTELLTSCGDGKIRIFDLRKHSNGAYNKCIDNLNRYSTDSAVSAFYNFQLKYPQNMHPTDAVYNRDGSEILSSHIHDACYLFINPTTIDLSDVAPPDQKLNDQSEDIMDFLKEEDANSNDEAPNDNRPDIEVHSGSEDVESVDSEVLNIAVVSRFAERHYQRLERGDNENSEDIDDLIEMGVNDEFMDYVQTLVERRREVLRLNASEDDFQDVLFDLVSKRELKLVALQALELDNGDKLKLL